MSTFAINKKNKYKCKKNGEKDLDSNVGDKGMVLYREKKSRKYDENALNIDFEMCNFFCTIKPVKDNLKTCGTRKNRWKTIYASSGVINTSDKREKKNVEDIKYGLKEISYLRPIEFEWKDISQQRNGKKNLGFIAQEVEEIIPEVVSSEDEGHLTFETIDSLRKKEYCLKGMYSHQLLPVIVKAIQELKEENDYLKDRINFLEDKYKTF